MLSVLFTACVFSVCVLCLARRRPFRRSCEIPCSVIRFEGEVPGRRSADPVSVFSRDFAGSGCGPVWFSCSCLVYIACTLLSSVL